MPVEELPDIGLGTLRNTNAVECRDTIVQAVDVGYRHIDTAQKYENEREVGEGIARADVSRDDLFVATKVDETNLDGDDVVETTTKSKVKLGIDVIDLLYIHWPAVSSEEDRYIPEKTIPMFNELLDDGIVRHVGVGNFSAELVAEAQDHFDHPILANQVEMHPLLQQRELVEHAQNNDMYLVAYSPLQRGAIGNVPEVVEVAEKHDATPAQVSLAWLMGKENVVPIPKARGAHLLENYRARDLELDADDVDLIESIEEEHRIVDREKGPWAW